MAALGSDEFSLYPASNTPAFLHLMKVLPPVPGDLSRILRIDDHKTTPGARSPTVKPIRGRWRHNVFSLNRTASAEALDKKIL